MRFGGRGGIARFIESLLFCVHWPPLSLTNAITDVPTFPGLGPPHHNARSAQKRNLDFGPMADPCVSRYFLPVCPGIPPNLPTPRAPSVPIARSISINAAGTLFIGKEAMKAGN